MCTVHLWEPWPVAAKRALREAVGVRPRVTALQQVGSSTRATFPLRHRRHVVPQHHKHSLMSLNSQAPVSKHVPVHKHADVHPCAAFPGLMLLVVTAVVELEVDVDETSKGTRADQYEIQAEHRLTERMLPIPRRAFSSWQLPVRNQTLEGTGTGLEQRQRLRSLQIDLRYFEWAPYRHFQHDAALKAQGNTDSTVVAEQAQANFAPASGGAFSSEVEWLVAAVDAVDFAKSHGKVPSAAIAALGAPPQAQEVAPPIASKVATMPSPMPM